MKKEQKEIYAPKEGEMGVYGSESGFIGKPKKSKFIYYALAVLAIAGLIIAFAI